MCGVKLYIKLVIKIACNKLTTKRVAHLKMFCNFSFEMFFIFLKTCQPSTFIIDKNNSNLYYNIFVVKQAIKFSLSSENYTVLWSIKQK